MCDYLLEEGVEETLEFVHLLVLLRRGYIYLLQIDYAALHRRCAKRESSLGFYPTLRQRGPHIT
jgi:hypothetical protein